MRNNSEMLASTQLLEQFAQEATCLGATAAAIIPAKEIQVKDTLAALCDGAYRCPYYGLAASCPPYVGGPAEFRKWQARSDYALTVRIDLPAAALFSAERKGVMQMLHHIVAQVEQKATRAGFKKSKGFAGGSCKALFCDDRENCRVIVGGRPCRHKEIARPSMSGYGIDVAHLMRASGWSATPAKRSNLSDKDAASWLAGLILIG